MSIPVAMTWVTSSDPSTRAAFDQAIWWRSPARLIQVHTKLLGSANSFDAASSPNPAAAKLASSGTRNSSETNFPSTSAER
jgi:hypothetical protein